MAKAEASVSSAVIPGASSIELTSMPCKAEASPLRASATRSLSIASSSHIKPSGSTTTVWGWGSFATARAAWAAASCTTGWPGPYKRAACHARNQPARKAGRSVGLPFAGGGVGESDSTVMTANARAARGGGLR